MSPLPRSPSEEAGTSAGEALASYADTLRHRADSASGAVALVCGEDRRTWRDLLVRSSRAANGMLDAGVLPQDRVAYLGRNSLEFFEVLYGASMVRAVPSGVNWRLADHEVVAVINDTRAPLLFIDAMFLPRLPADRSALRHVRKIVVVDAGDRPLPDRHEAYDGWLARQPAGDPAICAQDGDIAMQTYTSGTTGLPKGVMHTVSAIAATFATADILEISERTVALIATPTFHATAAAAVAMVLSAGGRCVIAQEADPQLLLELVVRHAVTMTILVPTIIKGIVEAPSFHQADVSSLQTLAYAGSPISTELLERARGALPHVRFLQIYGSTETLGVTVLRPEEHDDYPHAAGRPLPGVAVRTVDPVSGVEVTGSDRPGEIWVKAPTVMTGYWNLPEETNRTITTDGFVRTGDIGTLRDGLLVLLDRVDDMVVSGGENVYPTEVESVLITHPGVSDVAVIGVPSDRWGETVMAIVVPHVHDEHSPTADELIEYSRLRLARYKCPTAITFLDALPRNASGKVLKNALREPYWVGRDRRIG